MKTDKVHSFFIVVDILVAVFLLLTSTSLLHYSLGAIMAGIVARNIYELKQGDKHVKRIK